MKTLRFSILALLATTLVCQAQYTDPGWFRSTNHSLTVQSRDSYTPPGFLPAGGPPSPQPSAPVAEAITPQIQALADGLLDDPELIFNYVHDHIRFVLYFGAKKGAELTLLEKSGNDFDQSALLVALLSAAGYSNNVQYQFGWQQIPYDDPYGNDYDLHHWWRLTLNNSSNTWTTTTVPYLFDLIGNRGYPLGYYFNDGNTFEIQRTWVALTVGTNTYQLDPAFKISEPVTGISLTNAFGVTGTGMSNALLTAASGTDTGNYTQSLNEASLRTNLTRYTTNLLGYIQSNSPNASVQDIMGGWQITPAYDPWDYSVYTEFPTDDFGGQMPILGWTYEPTNMMSTLQITFAGITTNLYMPQLQGQRLSLVFSNNGVAQLWLDDSMLAQHATSGSGRTNVILFAHHPDGDWDTTNNVFINGTYADQTVTNDFQCTNAVYALLYAFEPDWSWLQQRQNKLDTYLQQGLTNGSRQVTSESLNVMGLNWMLQTAQTEGLLGTQLGIMPQYFHRLGRMAQETGNGYYVDVYMQLTGEFPSGGDDTNHTQIANAHFDLISFFASAFEHGIIEQLQTTNLVGASTVKMLQIANTNGQAVYLASSTNWTTAYNVKGQLVNYSTATLNQITSNYINNGFYVLLPQNGSNHVSGTSGSWAGYGYEARQVVNGQAADSRMIISGGYNGGYSSDPSIPIDPVYIDTSGDTQPTYFNTTPVTTPAPTGADPVDLANGTFQIESTDLSLGQAEPRGITLTRYYNGTRRFSNPAGMAGGWVHNYSITANNIAAPQACLGSTTPAQAASMLTATAAAIATYNGGFPNPKNWLTTALIAKWGVDQITKSGVSINLGKDTLQFVQQPNGVFTPPANCSATLTQTGSNYNLLQRHGNTFKFDLLGRLTNIVDQYSQSMSLTYNASNWVNTVKDWKNRTFTFTYSGAPSRLTSVSDGTRTVSYGYSTAYNAQGDLTSFTDAESKTNGYTYDANHQMTSTLDAQSRLVVSNIYDTQGHIKSQFTQGDTNKTWLIFWSGFQTTEFDPANDETDYYYDDQGRLVTVIDPLVNETDTSYDGQNHITLINSPLSEFTYYFYDGNNNLVQKIDPLGFTNQFVFDTNNNLIRALDQRGNTNTYGYNSQFSLTGVTNGAGDFLTYAYNSDGTLHTRTDSGGTTTYGYDSNGQLNSIIYPNSLGTNSFTNNAYGDVISLTDGRGFTTTFGYNNRRQLTNTVAPTNLVTTVTFDAEGNMASTKDRRGNVTSNVWSATRHLLSTAFPTMPQGTPILTNFYDSRDMLIKTLDPFSQPTLYTNDAAGQLTSISDPLSRTTIFTYDRDGRKISTKNAAGELIQQKWNARGNLIRTTDASSNKVLRAYDAAGNQITLTNRNTNVWHFSFDSANRLTNVLSPLSHQTSINFNHQGLVSSIKDPAGKTTTRNYDAKNRLTNRTDLLATTIYGYDANDNRVSVAESSLTNSWTYDAYNRVSVYSDANGNVIQYKYDANGNLTNLIYPGGKNVFYTFDNNNHLAQVKDWSGRVTILSYDLAGKLTNIARPNGTQRTITYDVGSQATNILESTPVGFPIALFKLNWNNAAEMQWEFAAPLPHTNAPPSRTMTYDPDNQLATVNGTTVSVDLDGNLTSGPLTNSSFFTFAYDPRNRLLNVGGVTNTYDAMNNRTGQTYGTNVVAFVVNPNSKLPQVLMRVKNGVTNYYVYGAGLLYQVTETATSTNTLTYHYDCRGSTVALSDDGGNVTDRIEYSAYATITYRSGTSDTPFLFNGLYGVMTDANGLLCMAARYYSPYLCRFINPDPSGFAGGLNFFAYANGNPVSLIDPFGLSFWSITGHFIEGAVIGAALTAAIIVAAPVVAAVAADLIITAAATAGVEVTAAAAGTYAVAAVDTGLLVVGGTGLAANGIDTAVNISNGNWDAAAFNVGNLAGGYAVGVSPFMGSSSGGRYLADSLTQISTGTIGLDGLGLGVSPAPEFAPYDLFGAAQYEFGNRLQFGRADSDLLAWSASAPTPFSGGLAATGIAAAPGSVYDLAQQVFGSTVSPTVNATSTGK